MTHARRTAARAAAVVVPFAVVLAVSVPASAKETIDLTVSAHRARVDTVVRLHAVGGDDGHQGPQQVCVQTRRSGHWRDLRCSRPGSVTEDEVGATVRERRPTTVRVRAELYFVSDHGHRRSAEESSETTTITVVR